jgi:hypothetical protein
MLAIINPKRGMIMLPDDASMVTGTINASVLPISGTGEPVRSDRVEVTGMLGVIWIFSGNNWRHALQSKNFLPSSD